MPSQIVLVHDDLDFAERAAAALRQEGYEVAALHDPMLALDALDAAHKLELLITRVSFGTGKVNGIALARMARHRRPNVRVLFTAVPEFEEHTAPQGEFLSMPVLIADLVATAKRLLADSAATKPAS